MRTLSTLTALAPIALASALLLGCGPRVQYAKTNQPPRPLAPRAASEVEVFNAENPERQYVQVGVLTIRQSGQPDMQTAIPLLQEKAGSVGCDGIVVVPPKGRGPVRAACIVFTEPAVEEAPKTAKTEPEPPKPEEPTSTEPTPSPESTAAPPDGSAGFVFAQSVDDAKAKCRDAKFRWRQVKGARYSCSGTPVAVGAPATARLRFCGGRLCEINVDTDRADAATPWPDAFRQTRDALAQKYGPARKTAETVGAECVDAELTKCVADARADLSAEWWWASGERIVQKLSPGEKANSIVVTLTYTKWPLDPPASAAPAAAPAPEAPPETQ